MPSCLIAAMPAGIESWRKPVVRENTSARNRAVGESGPNTLTGSVFDTDAFPSLTVTLALNCPPAVYTCDGSSDVESTVPSPSKSQA